MKKSLLFAAMLMACASVNAQEAKEVQVGSLANSWPANNVPMHSYWECSETEFLYTAEDLAGVLNPGEISKIEYAAYGGQWLYTKFTLWFENTDDTSVGGEDGKQFKSTDDMTKVYEDQTDSKFENGLGGSATEPVYLGFELNEPFQYTGGGLRVHFMSKSFYFCDTEFMFLQDDDKVMAAEEQNTVAKRAYGNWGSPVVTNPGRHFPIVKFTIKESTPPTPTAINDVAVKDVKEVSYYNVYGQKVAADTKGVVISSEGKKFINR